MYTVGATREEVCALSQCQTVRHSKTAEQSRTRSHENILWCMRVSVDEAGNQETTAKSNVFDVIFVNLTRRDKISSLGLGPRNRNNFSRIYKNRSVNKLEVSQ